MPILRILESAMPGAFPDEEEMLTVFVLSSGSGAACIFGSSPHQCMPVGCYGYQESHLGNSHLTTDFQGELIFKDGNGNSIEIPARGIVKNGEEIIVGRCPEFSLYAFLYSIKHILKMGKKTSTSSVYQIL